MNRELLIATILLEFSRQILIDDPDSLYIYDGGVETVGMDGPLNYGALADAIIKTHGGDKCLKD